jgi:hypothetical protein
MSAVCLSDGQYCKSMILSCTILSDVMHMMSLVHCHYTRSLQKLRLILIVTPNDSLDNETGARLGEEVMKPKGLE